MSGVRVLVGTRKGAFILTADGKRDKWEVKGPFFGGWEMYHMKGSAVDPNRIYASQSTGWFGQLIQRSDDGGATWNPVGNQFPTTACPGTHQWYDGTPHPWEFARVWHLEPSLSDPDTVLAGVEDAALFRTTDGGESWARDAGLARARDRAVLAARRWRDVPAHDHREPPGPRADLRGDLRRRRVSHRRRRRDLGAQEQGAALWGDPRPRRVRGPLRAPHRPAPVAPRRAVHAKALGRDAQRRRRRQVDRGQRQPADRLRLQHRRPRPRARDRLRRADHE